MEKKKFLFVSYDALINDIAWQVCKEGHDVKYFIKDEAAKDIADGFVPKTSDWTQDIEWADVIIFDDVLGFGHCAQELRLKGKRVVGGTAYTDRLEDDRTFGQQEMKSAGINIIPFMEFASFDDAIAYVQANPARYVIKPSGEAQNIKRLLFVGEEEDGKDIIQVLEAYKKAWFNEIKVFQLQKRMSGVEVAVGAFFNGSEFVFPININFEHKKLFPGNIGPSTGEMGTFMYWSGENKIFNATLKKMEKKLAEEHYTGYIDINCIVNAQGIYPLEFTARFGYPTISIQQEGILMPISEFLFQLAEGSLTQFKCRRGFQIGVRVVVPPYPFNDQNTFQAQSKNAAILFKKADNLEGVHIEDVKKVNEQWLIAGNTGVVLVVCAWGQTMKQAQNQVYNRINNIIIPSMYYRTDIGTRWYDDSDRLHAWGYLREV
ncbi:MAG TPA: phosphoribosylglycinamide synthetase C domain-containing protein [Candidatus Omnitrophota bacterium]|nr:phosphoribosylglycinamide synthetase C domain-containing protein [Candidatus Omnitrophota bacterium]HPN56565.1 phosphoribosylglycinamide synthetase C domain-containing protein [Candidatus Omnitrophota bacterium]